VGSAQLPACTRWPNSMLTIVKIHNSQSVISLKQAYLKTLILRTTYIFGKFLNKVKVGRFNIDETVSGVQGE
jgi:hypothetical protein